ncbi:MAG TPA: HIT domain-containing protein [Thermoanaerobaculia bacterium]|nr:HIT domain-containing protein [Thermoanaerobaculia bacterium]
MSCVFCNDPRDAGTLLDENEHAWVIRHPAGQTMIVARRHVENVSDLEESEWMEVARTWHRAERSMRQVAGDPSTALGMTRDERVIVLKLGVATPHLHIHLHPFDKTATREEIFLTLASR